MSPEQSKYITSAWKNPMETGGRKEPVLNNFRNEEKGRLKSCKHAWYCSGKAGSHGVQASELTS